MLALIVSLGCNKRGELYAMPAKADQTRDIMAMVQKEGAKQRLRISEHPRIKQSSSLDNSILIAA